MTNQDTLELRERMRNSAALQRSIGLTQGADLLDSAADAIEGLEAQLVIARVNSDGTRPASDDLPRVITTRDEAFALRNGAVVLNSPGRAFQITDRWGGPSDSIDHATAAWLLPLTVIHEGE